MRQVAVDQTTDRIQASPPYARIPVRATLACYLRMEVAQPPRDVLYCVHPRTASTLPRLVSTPGGPGLKQHQVDFAHDRVCWPQSRRSHRHERLSCRFTTRGSSLDCLQRLISPQQYEDLVVRHPEVLSSAFDSPINSWVDFLDAYGLDRTAISKLLLQCPELITCTSIYEAGRTLLFFRHLGWKYEQIRGRIIAQYPQVGGSLCSGCHGHQIC